MIEYRTYTLDNGLQIIHNPDPKRAMVALNLLYNVGARDEDPAHTGMAHLFEHLMFGGSQNVADFSRVIQNAGGSDNAWTSNDFTNFYCKLPAANVETGFWAESDRMLALSFDPKVLEVQRRVVVEEFKQQCLNQPYGDLMHKLRPALYGVDHPYSWPVIGKEYSHIEQVTPDDVQRWFYSHYAPNNAVLAVSGNIGFEQTVELASKWFGPIPRRDVTPRRLPHPAFPTTDITVEASGKVPSTLIVRAYPMDPYGTPDYYTADTITDLLSNGQSSRFVQRLMLGPEPIFAGVDASILGSEHEGMLMIVAQMADESPAAIQRAIELIDRETKCLAQPGEVSAYELERSLNRAEFTFTKSMTDYLERAQQLAMSVIHGVDLNQQIALQQRTTLDDIQRVSDKIFNHTPAVTLYYRNNTEA